MLFRSVSVFLTTADDIFISDPEAEYYPLVKRLHGQVIKLSPTSKDYVNPLDINLNYSEDDSPLALKSDFVLSFCELVMGGKTGLEAIERTVIDRAVKAIYRPYLAKKNFYCGNRSCQFVMWKNDRFFEQRKKAFTPKIAAALLKNGKAKVKGLYSEKTGKTYDATVLLADTGGKYVNYRVERKE